MSDHEIFTMLQDIECALFHKYADMASSDPHFQDAKRAHAEAKSALISFYNIVKENPQ